MADGTETVKPGDEKNTPPTFDDGQQKFINELFDKRFAKISTKHETEKKALEERVTALQTELDEAKKNVKSGDGKNSPEAEEKEKQLKDLLRTEQAKLKVAEQSIQAKENEAKAAKEEALRIRKEVAISRAAQKQNFFELDVVMAMTGSQIEFDSETNQFVVKENGVVKQNASLQPMTLDEFYTDFAAKRPYLVNGDVKSGTGSAENGRPAGNGGLVKTKADLKTAKDKSEFITKFGLEKYEDLPLK